MASNGDGISGHDASGNKAVGNDPSAPNSGGGSWPRQTYGRLPLVAGLMVAVAAASFFGGHYFSGASSAVTQEDLDRAIARLELRMVQDGMQAPSQAPPPTRISADDDPVIGDPNAPIAIVEFSDFECPFCARFSAQTLPLIQERYIERGHVKLVYRDFPLSSHPNAVPAALAAECAHDQGAFKEMHDKIFELQDQWSNLAVAEAASAFARYAAELNLDQDAFGLCVMDQDNAQEIINDLSDGRSYGVAGTPSFWIGSDDLGYIMVSGAQPFEAFQTVIDAQLRSLT